MSFLDSTRSFTIDSCANAPLLHRKGVSGDGGWAAGAEIEFVLVEWLVIQGGARRSLVLPCTADGCQSCLLNLSKHGTCYVGRGGGVCFSTP